jgi:hypothetical protein
VPLKVPLRVGEDAMNGLGGRKRKKKNGEYRQSRTSVIIVVRIT